MADEETWLEAAAPCSFASRDGSGEGRIVGISRTGVRVQTDELGDLKTRSRVKLEFRFFATSTPVRIETEAAAVESECLTLTFKDMQAVIKNMLRMAITKLRDTGPQSKTSLLPDY